MNYSSDTIFNMSILHIHLCINGFCTISVVQCHGGSVGTKRNKREGY